MPRRAHPFVPAVVIFITSSTLGINGPVFAAGACIEQPNREPPQGEHWTYRYDRESSRKCWYLIAGAAKPRAAPPDETSISALASRFASAVRKLTVTFPPAAPPDRKAGEPRINQNSPARPPRLEDMAQRPPDLPKERADPRNTSSLTPAERNALFEEFLRWDEIHRNQGNGGVPAR